MLRFNGPRWPQRSPSPLLFNLTNLTASTRSQPHHHNPHYQYKQLYSSTTSQQEQTPQPPPKHSKKFPTATSVMLLLLTSALSSLHYTDTINIPGLPESTKRAPKVKENTLDPYKYQKFTLISRTKLTPTADIFRFKLSLSHLDETSAKLAKIVEMVNEKSIWSVDLKDHYVQTCRSYTPINIHLPPTKNTKNGKENEGHMDLLVKYYPDGSVSRFIFNNARSPGNDVIEMRGPIVSWVYEPNKFDSIYMIAGGTGITPMYQLIQKILSNNNNTNSSSGSNEKLTLIYANRNQLEIPLYNELVDLKSRFKDRLDIHFVVDNYLPDNSDINIDSVGLLNKELIQSWLSSSNAKNNTDKSMVLVSGPPGMLNLICGNKLNDDSQGPVTGILGQLGFNNSNVFKL